MTAAAAAAAAQSVRARKRLIAALREQDALTPATAIPLAVPRRMDERMLNQLIGWGAVVQASPGRFYLDEAGLAAVEARHRRIRNIALPIAALGLAVLAYILSTRV